MAAAASAVMPIRAAWKKSLRSDDPAKSGTSTPPMTPASPGWMWPATNVSPAGLAIATLKLSVVPSMWKSAAPSALESTTGSVERSSRTSFPGVITA